jgi:GNAT superfamily N-acetyltransferase
MMAFTVQRLNEGQRATLLKHFLALPPKDRSTRFGAPVAPAGIAAYVSGINLDRDAVIGVQDEARSLVAVAHVAVEDNAAEVALSVLPEHRRRGIASALFGMALAHARASRVPMLVMCFLIANTPVLRIARKFGMRVAATSGEASARLDLRQIPPITTASGPVRTA